MYNNSNNNNNNNNEINNGNGLSDLFKRQLGCNKYKKSDLILDYGYVYANVLNNRKVFSIINNLDVDAEYSINTHDNQNGIASEVYFSLSKVCLIIILLDL